MKDILTTITLLFTLVMAAIGQIGLNAFYDANTTPIAGYMSFRIRKWGASFKRR
jgi:hypothetical protein